MYVWAYRIYVWAYHVRVISPEQLTEQLDKLR